MGMMTKPKKKTKKSNRPSVEAGRIIWIAVACVAAALLAMYILVWNNQEQPIPGSYEFCVSQGGYEIMIDPPQCELNGTLFVDQVK
jgi:hypothetical protein